MKIFLVFILILNSCLVFGQISWAPIGAEWYYNYREGVQTSATGYYLLKSIKDTIIDSKECKVLSRTLVNSKGISFNDGQSVIYYNSLENKIFRYLFDNFYLLYDFTKTAGDTIVIKEPNSTISYDSIVTVVDSVGIETFPDNIQLKLLYVRSVEESKFNFGGKIIEKIGNLGFMFPFNSLACDAGCSLPLRCYNDDQVNFVSQEHDVVQVPCDFVYTDASLVKTADLSVYPNPFTNSFTIKNGIHGERILSIDLFDLYGKPILHEDHPLSKDHEINFCNYPVGLYYLKIKTGSKTFTFKLIKNNNIQ